MRSTGTDQLVRARKAGNAAGAKGLGQAVVVNVQLATGGDLGGNEAVGCLVGAVCGERLPHRSVRGRGWNSSGLLAPACIGRWTCSSARTTRAYARGMEPRTWRSCATSLSTSCGALATNGASSGAASAPDGIPNISLNSSGYRPVNPDSLPCPPPPTRVSPLRRW